jgi:hypothetical protein
MIVYVLASTNSKSKLDTGDQRGALDAKLERETGLETSREVEQRNRYQTVSDEDTR